MSGAHARPARGHNDIVYVAAGRILRVGVARVNSVFSVSLPVIGMILVSLHTAYSIQASLNKEISDAISAPPTHTFQWDRLRHTATGHSLRGFTLYSSMTYEAWSVDEMECDAE